MIDVCGRVLTAGSNDWTCTIFSLWSTVWTILCLFFVGQIESTAFLSERRMQCIVGQDLQDYGTHSPPLGGLQYFSNVRAEAQMRSHY